MERISAAQAAKLLGISADKLATLKRQGIIHSPYASDEISRILSRQGLTISDEASIVGSEIQRETVSSISLFQKILRAIGGLFVGYLVLVGVLAILFIKDPTQTSDFFGYYYRFNVEAKSNVLAAATGPIDVAYSTSVVADILKPAAAASLVAVKAVNSQVYDQIVVNPAQTGTTTIVTGPAGTNGTPGAAGVSGAKGDIGATGSTGSAGAKGDKGDTGTVALAPASFTGSMLYFDGLNWVETKQSLNTGLSYNPTSLTMNGDEFVSGSVGIGTTTPETTLDVNGPAIIRGSSTDQVRALQIVGKPMDSWGQGLRITNTGTGGGDFTLVVTDDSNGEGGGNLLFINENLYPNNLAMALTLNNHVIIGSSFSDNEVGKLQVEGNTTIEDFLGIGTFSLASPLRGPLDVHKVESAVAATGVIYASDQLADGDTITITDALAATKTFEFDDVGGVSPGNVSVTIGAGMDDTLTNLATAISANLDISAIFDMGDEGVHLTDITMGASGNVNIVFVADNISDVNGMSGGVDASNYDLYVDGLTGNLTTAGGITTSGNVGIGTTSPVYALDVKAEGTGIIARFNSDYDTSCTLATDGTLSCTSDKSLKKNIEDVGYGLAEVIKLKPIAFNWNFDSDGREKSLGFIAQDVQGVVPNLVSTDQNGLLTLNTIGMIPILTHAIQQLSGYLGSVSGGTLDSLFAKTIRTEQICLDKSAGGEVCINADQLDKLLPTPAPTATPVPTDSPTASPSATPTDIPTPIDSESPTPLASP